MGLLTLVLGLGPCAEGPSKRYRPTSATPQRLALV